MRIIERVEKQFRVTEPKLDRESLVPETKEIANGLLEVHKFFTQRRKEKTQRK